MPKIKVIREMTERQVPYSGIALGHTFRDPAEPGVVLLRSFQENSMCYSAVRLNGALAGQLRGFEPSYLVMEVEVSMTYKDV